MEIFKGYYAVVYLAAIVGLGLAIERVHPVGRESGLSVARWLRASGLNLQGIALLSLLPAISGYGAAVAAEEQGFGLLNAAPVPFWAAFIVTLIVTDAVAFAQHWSLHRWPLLWRLHRAHHSDRTVDASTSLRFHPLETMYRAALEAPVIFLFGLPPEGVLLAFGVYVVVNSYTHMSLNLPVAAERAAGLLVITPRMHRLHHETNEHSQRTNYGAILSVWDRLLGTLRGPDKISDHACLGLKTRAGRETFGLLLMEPFLRNQPATGRAAEPAATSAGGASAGPPRNVK